MNKQDILAHMRRRPTTFADGVLTGCASRGFGEVLRAVRSAAACLSQPFSLCQLALTPADREWLQRWPSEVSGSALDAALRDEDRGSEGFSPFEAVGLVLLLVATEVGRQFAVSGEIWPVLHKRFPPQVAAALFAGKHPKQVVRQAMEAACRRLGLRHAFGLEGTQAYYLTIYLQFGFGQQSLARLPLWLESPQDRPRSVEILLESSDEFSTLWDALKAWVAGEASARETGVIESSPFIPSEWLPLIGAGASPDRQRGIRFAWESHGPPVACVDLNALYPDFEDSAYLLSWGTEQHLVVREEGKFDPPTLLIEITKTEESLLLEPLDASSAPHVETLRFWSEEDDYVLLDPSRGQALRRVPRGPFWLVTSSEYRASEGYVRWHALPGGWRIYELAAPPRGSFLVGPDGPVNLDQGSSQSPLSEAKLEVFPDARVVIPGTVQCAVTDLDRSLQDCRFSFRSRTLTPEMQMGFPVLDVELPVDLASLEVKLLVRARHNGRAFQKTVVAPLNIQFASWRDRGVWKRLDNVPELDASEMARSPIRLFLHQGHFALVEGNTLSVGVREGEQYLKQLAGLGAPLVLRNGPFHPLGKDLVLARRLVDRGYLAKITAGAGRFRLATSRPLPRDPEHYLVWWDGGFNAIRTSLEHLEVSADGISGELPPEMRGRPFAVALGLRSVRLGVSWSEVLSPPEFADWSQVAYLLRWMQLPLLADSWWSAWRGVLEQHWRPVLQAWLGELRFRLGERWLEIPERQEFAEVIVRLVARVQPTPADGQQLLEQFRLSQWIRCAPRFATRLLAGQPVHLLRAMLFRDYGASNSRDLDALREKAARNLLADAFFIDSLLEKFCQEQLDPSLSLALTQTTFANLAVARCMGKRVWQD